MDMTTFSALADTARLWIYGFDRRLAPREAALVSERLDAFCAQWRSHGRPVRNAWSLVDQRFLVLAGDIPDGDISGCGIDASVRILKKLRDDHGLNALDHGLVHYRDAAGAIHSVKRHVFQTLVERGEVIGDTSVCDLTLETLGDLRAGGLEKPLRHSWHAQAFAVAVRG